MRVHSRASEEFSTQSGFSLVELMIAVAIILILGAIAIPSYVRARISANESSAVASERNIVSAETVYSSTYDTGYTTTLQVLAPPPGNVTVNANNAGLIDDVLASGIKSGYRFTYAPAPPDNSGHINAFTLNADPLAPGVTGIRHFFTDAGGVIRYNLINPATVNDSPI